MRRKRGAIRSTSLSSPPAQSTASSVAAMTMPAMAAQITLKTSAVVLSRAPANGRWMRLSLVVETGDSVRDGAGERVGIGEGAVGEVLLLGGAPASFDIVQFWGVFGQPFEGEPGALGERLCGQLAAVDRPVIENRDQGPGAFRGALYVAELIEQGNEVGGALGGAGMDEQVPVYRIKGAEHRPLFRLAGRLDAQVRSAPGPAAGQIGMRERLGFV